jgi:hypothetical protein
MPNLLQLKVLLQQLMWFWSIAEKQWNNYAVSALLRNENFGIYL